MDLAACVAGAPAAWEVFVRASMGLVHAVAVRVAPRYGVDARDVEDAVQSDRPVKRQPALGASDG